MPTVFQTFDPIIIMNEVFTEWIVKIHFSSPDIAKKIIKMVIRWCALIRNTLEENKNPLSECSLDSNITTGVWEQLMLALHILCFAT